MISIILPVYNVEKYLKQCIDSILAQTYKCFELLLIDDGSTDKSPEICDAYETIDDRIKVFHKKNGGLSDARNFGIENAHGEYITFVDSDDMLFQNALEIMISLRNKYSGQIVSCGYVRCEDKDKICDLTLIPFENKICVYSDDRMREFMEHETIGTQAWGKLYDISLFEEIRYPKGKYHEDVFTTYKLIDKAKCVVVSDQKIYAYRQNPESITQKFSPKRLDSIEGAYLRAKYIEKKYPQLLPYAYREIIYACNICVYQMGKYGYRDLAAEEKIQDIYRKYGKYYCTDKRNLLKNFFVYMCQIDLRLTMKLSKFIKI